MVAQDEQPGEAVYIVQAGDTLWDISLRFGVTMDELHDANNLSDGSQLKEGDQLRIPGLEGVEGVLTTQYVPLGKSLNSLSRASGTAPGTLVRLNHLVSPQEIYAGMSLIIPQKEQANPYGQRAGHAERAIPARAGGPEKCLPVDIGAGQPAWGQLGSPAR